MRASLAASVAVRPLLLGGPRRLARTLSVRQAVAFGPIAFVDDEAVLPPHGCGTADGALIARLSLCDEVEVGSGRVVAGGIELGVGRWWDPRPRTAPTSPANLAAQVTALDASPVAELVHAPHRAAAGLLGSGGGLTPAGDDVLVGFVATVRVLTGALAAAPPPWQASLQRWLRDHAPQRTTDLSARLLVHATRGEVITPLAAVLHALCRGDGLARAAARLSHVGASSGRELLAGVASGLAVLVADAKGAAA